MSQQYAHDLYKCMKCVVFFVERQLINPGAEILHKFANGLPATRELLLSTQLQAVQRCVCCAAVDDLSETLGGQAWHIYISSSGRKIIAPKNNTSLSL